MIEGVWKQGADENFAPKREEVTEGQEELHEQLYNVHPSANFIRMIK
jgi:hypothetical protein